MTLVELPTDGRAVRFDEFLASVEAPLRRALVAAYGPDLGGEAAADALAYAWEHLERVGAMGNPAGYLWRVGQTSVRRATRRRWREQPWPGPAKDRRTAPPADLGDPGLQAALSRLTPHQRAAAVLVHGFGYPLAEAAAVLGCSVSSLRNHLDRALNTPPLLVWHDTEMALIDYSGKELARAPMGRWYTNDPDLGIDLVTSGRGVKPVDAVAIDDPIPGCDAVHGRGGILAAACGGPTGDGPTEIRVVGADGEARRLTGARHHTGHWRYALPSPDGKWVLGQWSGECEVPSAFLIEVASGRVDDVAPAAVESNGIGWTPDGRATVGIGSGPCSQDTSDTGTFLVDPTRKVRTRIHPFSAGTTVQWAHQPYNRLERRVDRALDELGLEGCCGEPSHGSEINTAGMIYEGTQIEIHAAPVSLAGKLDPPRPDMVRFRCGNDIYSLLEFDSNRPNMARVARAADRLATRLYCTRRPA